MSTNLKKIVLIVSCAVLFVCSFGTIGVFGSDVSSVAPDLVWGVDNYAFSQFGTVNFGEKLFSFTIPENFNVSYTSNEYYPIFNNVNMKYRLSGNGSRYLFDISSGSGSSQLDALAWNSVYPVTFDVYRLNIGGNDSIVCTLHGNPLDSSNDTMLSLTSYLSPSVSFGSSWVWDNLGTVGETLTETLSPGYALVISGPCEISDRTFAINNSWNFVDIGDNSSVNGSFQRTVAVNNLVDGFSPDRNLSVSQLLPWNALNRNVVGVASTYDYHAIDVISLSSGNNYVLGYPVYYQRPGSYGVLERNSVDLSVSLYFQYSGTRPVIRKISIQSISEIVDGQTRYYSVFRPDVYDQVGTIVSDGNGGITATFPVAPPDGGNTGEPSATDDDTSLLGVIQRFVNQITGLFTTAIDAIRTLVNSGSVFMHNLTEIYSWLPQPFLTVLIAGLTVALIIGVLKLLF